MTIEASSTKTGSGTSGGAVGKQSPHTEAALAQGRDAELALGEENGCVAEILDWNDVISSSSSDQKVVKHRHAFDIVLASDCIYMVAMAALVAKVVAALLRPGGFAMLVFPEGRRGVPEFLELMKG